jgi:hypothetical protein
MVLYRGGPNGNFPILQVFVNRRRWTVGLDGSSGTLHLCLPMVQLTIWWPTEWLRRNCVRRSLMGIPKKFRKG